MTAAAPFACTFPMPADQRLANERSDGHVEGLRQAMLAAQLVGSDPAVIGLGGKYTARTIIQHIDNLIAEQSHG